MIIPQETLEEEYLSTEICRRGSEQKRHRIGVNDVQVAAGTLFYARNQIVEKVDTLKYLGRILHLL